MTLHTLIASNLFLEGASSHISIMSGSMMIVGCPDEEDHWRLYTWFCTNKVFEFYSLLYCSVGDLTKPWLDQTLAPFKSLLALIWYGLFSCMACHLNIFCRCPKGTTYSKQFKSSHTRLCGLNKWEQKLSKQEKIMSLLKHMDALMAIVLQT